MSSNWPGPKANGRIRYFLLLAARRALPERFAVARFDVARRFAAGFFALTGFAALTTFFADFATLAIFILLLVFPEASRPVCPDESFLLARLHFSSSGLMHGKLYSDHSRIGAMTFKKVHGMDRNVPWKPRQPAPRNEREPPVTGPSDRKLSAGWLRRQKRSKPVEIMTKRAANGVRTQCSPVGVDAVVGR